MAATLALCLGLWTAGMEAGAQTVKLTATGSVGGHEYVDLGLSVWWATCNIGTTQASGYGDRFGWGETTKKLEYTPGNSLTYEKTGLGDIFGSLKYDAAYAQWGDRWRLPTRDEMQELIDHCTWRWTNVRGIEGYLVISNINGKQIFLPAAGMGNGASVEGRGEDGYYWASTPFGADRACSLCFYQGHKDLNWYQRFYGRSIRAVTTGEPVVAASKTAGAAGTGSRDLVSDNPAWQALLEAHNDEKATLKVGDGDLDGVPQPTKHHTHRSVDMGLSVRWATTNIGADFPLESGDYFAWGEVVTKKSYDASNGKTMGQRKIGDWTVRDISARPNYDAARAQWGDQWRLPTLAEIEELVNRCEWIYMEADDGRSFYVVNGPQKDSQIILPLVGQKHGIEDRYNHESGFYWTSTADVTGVNDYNYAFYLYLDAKHINSAMEERRVGFPIRPVTDYKSK